MRHPVLSAVVVVVLGLSGCGGDSSADTDSDASADAPASTATGDAAPSPSPSPEEPASTPAESSADQVVVEVRIKNGAVDPSGDRVNVKAGQPIEFVVESDAATEMHVHSTPEHSIDIKAGRTKKTITIDRPGVVEVELHEPDVVVVQLEVK